MITTDPQKRAARLAELLEILGQRTEAADRDLLLDTRDVCAQATDVRLPVRGACLLFLLDTAYCNLLPLGTYP